MTLYVTGLTGRTGRHFYTNLLNGSNNRMLNIRAVLRPGKTLDDITTDALNIEYFNCDLNDEEAIYSTMKGSDTVFHIASIFFSLNIVGSAIRAGVKRIILVHTTGVYSKYKSASADYVSIESEINNLLNGKGICLTILRPTMIYGSVEDNNIVRFIRMADRLPVIPLVNRGNYPLQPVHAKDLGNAYYQVLTRSEEASSNDYILSGKEPIMLRQMFEILGGHLHKHKIRFLPVPLPIVYSGAWLLYIFTLKRKDFREKVQRLAESRAFPHDKAVKDFGYSPRSFEDGVKEEVRQYLSLRTLS